MEESWCLSSWAVSEGGTRREEAVQAQDVIEATEDTQDNTQEPASDDGDEWPVEKKEAETALILYFDNTSKTEMSISVTLKGKDGQTLDNMKYPLSSI